MIPPLAALSEVFADLGSFYGSWEGVGMLLAQDEPPADADVPFFVRLLNNPLVLPAGVMLIFYLTFIAPERRRKVEEAKRLAAISKNDKVITAGGLHGTVTHAPADSDVVTLRLEGGSGVQIKVSRWAVSTIVDKKSDKDGD